MATTIRDRAARVQSARRVGQVALGLIWLADGALQLQPYMLSSKFATQLLIGTAMGQPAPIADSVDTVARLIAPHIVPFDLGFAVVQLLIGVGLLVPRTVKVTLLASLAWVLPVWWLGESFGQMLTPSMGTELAGAPGAVLLYGLIALVLWPRPDRADGVTRPGGSVAAGGLLGDSGARWVWAVLWLGLAAIRLLPVNRTSTAVSAALASGAAGEPSALAGLDRAAARFVAPEGVAVALALAVIEALIGLGVLLRRSNPALVAGAVFALVIWVVGQNFGGILTGTGTDPNTGPLLILLALCLWQWRSWSWTGAEMAPAVRGAPRGALLALRPVGTDCTTIEERQASAWQSHGSGPDMTSSTAGGARR